MLLPGGQQLAGRIRYYYGLSRSSWAKFPDVTDSQSIGPQRRREEDTLAQQFNANITFQDDVRQHPAKTADLIEKICGMLPDDTEFTAFKPLLFFSPPEKPHPQLLDLTEPAGKVPNLTSIRIRDLKPSSITKIPIFCRTD